MQFNKTQSKDAAVLVAQPQPGTPDAYCITTSDGGCISTDPRCMHQPQAEAVPPDVVRDAERLDYLQRRGATVELLPGTDGFYPMRFRVGGLHAAVSENIRGAIDAAMAQGEKP